MQPLQHRRIRPSCQKRLVCMHAVARQDCRARLQHVFPDVGQEVGGCGFGGRRGGQDRGSQAGAAVGVNTPGGHGVESVFGVMDDGFEARGLEEAQVRIGDETADLEDAVGIGVKAGHLSVF